MLLIVMCLNYPDLMQKEYFTVYGAISTKKQIPMTSKGFPKFPSSTHIPITSMWANKVYRSTHPKIKSIQGAFNSNKHVFKQRNLNNMHAQCHILEQHMFFGTVSFGGMLFLVILLKQCWSPTFSTNLAS